MRSSSMVPAGCAALPRTLLRRGRLRTQCILHRWRPAAGAIAAYSMRPQRYFAMPGRDAARAARAGAIAYGEQHAHRRTEGNQEPRIPRRHDACRSARSRAPRPRRAGPGRRRRRDRLRRRGLPAGRRAGRRRCRRRLRARRHDRQGQGAAAGRMPHAAQGPGAVHLPPPGARSGADGTAAALRLHGASPTRRSPMPAAGCRCWPR